MSFRRHAVSRLLLTLPVLVGMSMLVFLLIHLVPGDPAVAILGLHASPAAIALIHRQLGLDLPLPQQYWLWFTGMLHGNLGQDYQTHHTVTSLLATRLPVTGELAFLAIVLATVTAVPLGVGAAARRGRAADRASMAMSLLGISFPDFWIGIVLILLLASHLSALPAGGFVPLSHGLVANLQHMLLPSMALAVGLAGVLTRVTRVSVLDVISQDYIRVARAKGLRERIVIYRHALPNAALPIITVIGLQVGYLLGGSVIMEQVFDLPGVGSLVVNASLERNYPVVQAGVLTIALMFILVNLTADLLYFYFDPRIRVD